MRKTFLTIFALLLLGSILPANGQPGYVPSEEIKAYIAKTIVSSGVCFR